MPLGTLDRTPPPFFRQGQSAFSKLVVFSALALFLMVADLRFSITQPIRAVLASVIYPVQWLALRPVLWSREAGTYLESRASAQAEEDRARRRLVEQSERANQVEQLLLENQNLRQLLELRGRFLTQSKPAQVLYDAADPYSRKLIIDQGLANGVQAGSPVLDAQGVLGQVTRVYALVSEVTLVTDPDHVIAVLNTRTGGRGLASGAPQPQAGTMELRFMAAHADVQAGDLLTTSGVDGVYPPGLPVARVERVEQRSDSIFARIYCQPVGQVSGVSHVLVLQPIAEQIPQRPAAETRAKAGAKKKS
ncbi:MAG: rod shape-determining protein MreC [Burkholderiaceae bacterium]